jgi:hypothetical protein
MKHLFYIDYRINEMTSKRKRPENYVDSMEVENHMISCIIHSIQAKLLNNNHPNIKDRILTTNSKVYRLLKKLKQIARQEDLPSGLRSTFNNSLSTSDKNSFVWIDLISYLLPRESYHNDLSVIHVIGTLKGYPCNDLGV